MLVSPRGTTLVELVVAVGLIGTLLLSAAGLLALGSRQVRFARNRSRALAVASSTIEIIEGWSYHTIGSRLGCPGDVSVCSADSPEYLVSRLAPEERGSPVFRLRVELRSLDGGTLASCRLMRVDVVVGWSEPGREADLRLSVVRG